MQVERSLLLCLIVSLAGGAGSGRLLAQPPAPLGPEFQANTYTTDRQDLPAVGPDGAGGFVVTWDSIGSYGNDSDGRSIQAQRYEANGSALGSQFQVNTYTAGDQSRSVVGLDGSGGFIIAWQSDGSPGNDISVESIQARRYDSSGLPLGDQFQVNTYTTNTQATAEIVPDGAGGLVILWTSLGSHIDDSSHSVWGRRFLSDGTPVGAEFQVNTYSTASQCCPSASPDGNGGFVVIWSGNGSSGTDTSNGSVQAQRFTSDGSPAGSEFQVNTYTTYNQSPGGVAPDGAAGFVVTWGGTGAGDISGIHAQRYDEGGSPVGGEFQVNTYTTSYQLLAEVMSDGHAGFVVLWNSDGSEGDTDNRSIQGRRYKADGTPASGQFQVNTYTTGLQVYPNVGPDGAGGFVVTWASVGSSGTDSDHRSVLAQRYAGSEIFVDGFESGDLAAWSVAVP